MRLFDDIFRYFILAIIDTTMYFPECVKILYFTQCLWCILPKIFLMSKNTVKKKCFFTNFFGYKWNG